MVNAAGALSHKHADFNNLRWLKGSVIILSLVKTGSRISSVSFYTPEPPHSSWDRGWSFIAAARGGCKNKSWVWDGLRGQLAPILSLSQGGRKKRKKKRKMRAGAWVAPLCSVLTQFNIHWKLRVIPRRAGRTYVSLHHRGVRWGTGS